LKPLEQFKRYRRPDRDQWEYQYLCLACHADQEAERRAFVDRPLCACGCGEQVKYPGATYRFGHRIRVEPKDWKVQSLTDGSDKPKKYERADKRKFRKCSKCGEVKEVAEFDQYNATNYYGQVSTRSASHCKVCARARTRDYRSSLTGDARAEYLRQNKDQSLRRKYGITLAEFEELKRSQGDTCAVCKQWRDLPAVDHCHKTGHVRGILCRKCNTALGMLDEDKNIVSSLLAYLQRHYK
jgi:hypothetical protein